MASSDESDTFIGPVLPPHLTAEQDDYYGPALPPGFKKQEEKLDDKVIGPALPPNWKQDSKEEISDEDEVIGPMPTVANDVAGISKIEEEFEKRADKMKRKLCGTELSKEIKREEWMTQLPAELGKSFGLGPRTFSRKTVVEGSDDKSSWTDTPADKERKERERIEGKPENKEEIEETKNPYDEEMAKIAAEYNESLKRDEPLVDIHKKKLKRKAKEEKNNAQERRPFDRDVDLKVNRFDEAQRDSIIKRSRQLGSRFSAGKAKFL